MINPTWTSGAVSLWHGDCHEVLSSMIEHLMDRKDITLCTDPPYGIGEAAGKNKSRGHLAPARDYGDDPWDNQPDEYGIGLARSCSHQQIVFGGNYYSLPPTSCWLVWDKENGRNDFADCELAWTNLPRATRLLRYRWAGFVRDGADPRGLHPTQKPVDVMRWALGFTNAGCTVLDPYMGSGTTGIAAIRLGRPFWGIEREEKYFRTARQRIEDELDRYPLLEGSTCPRQNQQQLF